MLYLYSPFSLYARKRRGRRVHAYPSRRRRKVRARLIRRSVEYSTPSGARNRGTSDPIFSGCTVLGSFFSLLYLPPEFRVFNGGREGAEMRGCSVGSSAENFGLPEKKKKLRKILTRRRRRPTCIFLVSDGFYGNRLPILLLRQIWPAGGRREVREESVSRVMSMK